jgi:ADP-heptose:LPS heptosyltransferase
MGSTCCRGGGHVLHAACKASLHAPSENAQALSLIFDMESLSRHWLDKVIGQCLCAVLSVWAYVFPDNEPDLPPRKVLVIFLSEAGRAVLARPMLEKIRKDAPDVELHVLTDSRNAEIFQIFGIENDKLLTVRTETAWGCVMDILRLLPVLRRVEPTVAIDGGLFTRVSAIVAYLSGASVRVGFHRKNEEGNYRGSFINRAVPYNPYRHFSRQLLTLADAVYQMASPANKASQDFIPGYIEKCGIDADGRKHLSDRLQRDFPETIGKQLILMYPGGGDQALKAWPSSYFLAVCRKLLARQYVVGLLGSEKDDSLLDEIRQGSGSPNVIDLSGYANTVGELLVLFDLSELLIANDGEVSQLAALHSISVITLYGPETPLLYRPLKEQSYCFYSELPCSPCMTAYNHRRSYCDGDNQCLQLIRPESVLKQALSFLAVRSDPAMS